MRAALLAGVSLFEFRGRERFRYLFDISTVVGQARRLPSAECELETTRLGKRSARPTKIEIRSAPTLLEFPARISSMR